MGFLKRFASLFSGSARPSPDDGIYVYVKVRRSGEVVRLRISKGNEITRDDAGDLFVRKIAMGQRSFERVEVVIYFDSRYRVINSEITGGELVDEADYQKSAVKPPDFPTGIPLR